MEFSLRNALASLDARLDRSIMLLLANTLPEAAHLPFMTPAAIATMSEAGLLR